MSNMSHISVIERYHELREAIDELLASLLAGIAEGRLLDCPEELRRAVSWLGRHYPFVDIIFTLAPDGTQTSDNLAGPGKQARELAPARGKDRSQRPYFRLAREASSVVVTPPYLSSANHKLCLSAAQRLYSGTGETLGYLVLDVDLAEAVGFLMGDTRRRRAQPLFKIVYSLIAAGLFAVVGVLIYAGLGEILSLFAPGGHADLHLKPFGVIVFLTLALAVFDLGKTTLEEEVLMHKDIFRHSSTRRTITRFMAAILVAVSIESLLLMFKSVLGEGDHLIQAVAMMATAVGLLIGLGLYVYFGARAEAILLKSRDISAAPRHRQGDPVRDIDNHYHSH